MKGGFYLNFKSKDEIENIKNYANSNRRNEIWSDNDILIDNLCEHVLNLIDENLELRRKMLSLQEDINTFGELSYRIESIAQDTYLEIELMNLRK